MKVRHIVSTLLILLLLPAAGLLPAQAGARPAERSKIVFAVK